MHLPRPEGMKDKSQLGKEDSERNCDRPSYSKKLLEFIVRVLME